MADTLWAPVVSFKITIETDRSGLAVVHSRFIIHLFYKSFPVFLVPFELPLRILDLNRTYWALAFLCFSALTKMTKSSAFSLHINPLNYGTFVPTYFRSQERKYHKWNFRSMELSLPGTFVHCKFRPRTNTRNVYPSLPAQKNVGPHSRNFLGKF